MATKRKKKAVEIASEMFEKGYATAAWYKKFNKATADELKAEKAAKKKAAVKKVPKPRKKSRSAFEWSDIVEYIQKKYGKDVRDWAGRYSKKKRNESAEYQDFWHFICDKCEVHNGATIWLFPYDWMEEEGCEDWKKEICQILVDEFGSDFEAFVSW